MYNVNKIKPLTIIKDAHANGWISALCSNYNTDMIVSGAIDDHLNFYQVDPLKEKLEKKFSVRCVGNVNFKEGVVNDIQINREGTLMAVVTGGENRLGRWITKKVKSHIKLFVLR